MAANSSIDLTTLDTDLIASSLKTYLNSQEVFKDYNFDGSNLGVLINLLSYNTFLNSFYLNMIASESFLDTAQLDTSTYSHAKELNYTPKSATSAKATVTIQFSTSNVSTIILPKGTGFTAKVGTNSYSFYTDTTQVFHSSNNTWTIPNIDIYEGSYVTDTFVMNYADTNQRFILSNDTVDVSTVAVTLIEDGSTYLSYLKKQTLLDVTDQSQVFFVQGSEGGMFEVIFGDGISGRRPKDGAIISINYRISSGTGPNGAAKFTLNSDITGGSLQGVTTVSTTSSAIGGDVKETASSVKFNAPRYFQTQERAITPTDYETLMKIQFPEIKNIAIYGGETVSPPRFGKVFVSVDISNVLGFPDSKKNLYYNFLKPKMPLTHEPIFVSPTYIYYSINSLVRYNVNLTQMTPAEIATIVKNSIVNFDATYLGKFNSILRYSQLTKTMDAADTSIISNETEVYAYKKIYPKLNTSQNIKINFNLPILNTLFPIGKVHPIADLHAIYSTEIFYNGESCYIEDDANGIIRIVKSSGDNHIVVTEVGTVDYASGVVNLVNFNIDYYSGSELKIYAITAEKDIYAGQNDILQLEPSEINLTIQAIRE